MREVLSYSLPAMAAAVLAFALAPLASRLAVAIGAVDHPGERKIHASAIPRLGGLAVVTAIAIVLAAIQVVSLGRLQIPVQFLTPLVLGGLPIFAISLIDDIRPVGARKKLLAHLVGAAIAVALGVSLGPQVHLFGNAINIGIFAPVLSVLWIAGVTNAFNIIDGLDGLSAGLALISAVSMAAVFILLGERQMGGIVLVLAGALAGFLPYNAHPARLFLGDCGATAIGFSLSLFALKGGSTLTSGFAALLPVFILGLPIADTLITMARRTVGRLENRDKGMFRPDRNHIHHRLLALGVGHARAVLILYGAGLAFAAAAFISIFLNAREASLFVVALLIAGFIGVHRLGYDEFAFIRRGSVLKVYEMPAVKRGLFVVFVDVFLAIVTAYIAVCLKSDVWSVAAARGPWLDLVTTLVPATVLAFWWSGMYRGSWRVAGPYEFTRAGGAVLMTTVGGGLIVDAVSTNAYPASLFVVYGLVSLLLTVSSRGSYVVLDMIRLRASRHGVPVLIYGAGPSGVAAALELFRNPAAGFRPVGFVDDDVRQRGRSIMGLPVFGTGREIESIVRATGVEAVLVSGSRMSQERLATISEACARAGASIRRYNVQVEGLEEPPAAAPVDIRVMRS